jgi:hypothetical protein
MKHSARIEPQRTQLSVLGTNARAPVKLLKKGRLVFKVCGYDDVLAE